MTDAAPESTATGNRYAPPTAVVRDVVDGVDPLTPAGRGTRLGATMIDGLFFTIVVYVPLVVFVGLLPLATGTFDWTAGGALKGIGIALLGLAVFTYLNIRFVLANGQTVGKRMLGIKVLRSDGSKASLGRLFWLRNAITGALGLVPIINIIVGLVDALMIFGERRQCLHDRIADTIVVRA